MKKSVLVLVTAIILLGTVVVVRTAQVGTQQSEIAPVQGIEVDPAVLAERLGQALRIPTVSAQDPTKTNGDTFLALRRLFEKNYPKEYYDYRSIRPEKGLRQREGSCPSSFAQATHLSYSSSI